MKKTILTTVLLALFLLSSCSKTVMTVESTCSYKDGVYTVKANRELMDRGIYFSSDQIYHSAVDQWGLTNNQEQILEGAKDFITGPGFSDTIISCLLYPYLSRDAAAYEIPGMES